MTSIPSPHPSVFGLARHCIVIGVPLVAILAVALFGEPLFENNDDAALAMVGAGFGIAAVPDAHLVFSHYGYGLLLNALSRVVGAQAHGWTTLAAIGLSIGLFTRSIMSPSRSSGLVVASLVAGMGLIFANALLRPQFTTTAALLLATAMACRIVMIRDGQDSTIVKTLIYGAVVLSFLIRPAAAVMVLLIAAPGLLWLIWRSPRPERTLMTGFLAVVLVLTALAYLTDMAVYAFSPPWSGALEYNRLRALFNDFHRIPWVADAPEYKRVGWSHNDYLMFMDWYANHPIFDLANVSYLANSFATGSSLLVFDQIWAWLQFPTRSPIIAALLASQIVLCVLVERQRLSWLFMLGGFIALFAAGATGRSPLFRVWFACAGAVLVFMLAIVPRIGKFPGTLPRMKFVGCASLVLLALFVASEIWREHSQNEVAVRSYRSMLWRAEDHLTGKVIVWGGSLAWEWLVTPTRVHPPVSTRTMLGLGVLSRTPIGEATRNHLGISDLGQTLCTDRDIRLVARVKFARQVETFCAEHYDVRPNFRVVFQEEELTIFAPAKTGSSEPE